MDFSFLDVLLDSVFVIDGNKNTIYCNDAAANLCQSSVKRLTRGKPLFEFIQFSDSEILTMPQGTKGLNEVYPITEIDYFLPNSEDHKGKVQISISPIKDDKNDYWIVLIRDVTIEQVLHEKYKLQLEQLEQYSKNLEKMVEERTLELKKANNLLNAIMNSLGQGFLVFDESGKCSNIYTKACEDVLECKPADKNIVSVLNCTGSDKEQFEMWLQAVFSEALPFDSLKDLGPQEFKHSKGKYITLDFFAIYSEDEKINNVVLVATDKSAERDAQQALEKERAYASMIVKFVTQRKLFASFLQALPQTIAFLSQQISETKMDFDEIFRRVHTLEGEAATLSIASLLQKAKNLQEVISHARTDQNLDISKLKEDYIFSLQALSDEYRSFLDRNSELIEMLNLKSDEQKIEIKKERIFYFYDLFEKAGLDSSLNQQFLSEFTKVSIFEELKSGNNVLSQVANKLGKKIQPIQFKGEDLRVDLNCYSNLFSSFVHIFRNIVDHGLEEPEKRLDRGKPEAGSVTINVARNKIAMDNCIQIRIVDDGNGIDSDKIRQKLQKNQPDMNWSKFDDHRIIQEIFSPGFSSREQAGEFSGRGVGMDAVKTEVLKLGGKIEVFSVQGKGTTIEIIIPDIENMEVKKAA